MDSFEGWNEVTLGFEGCDRCDQPTPTTGRRSESIPVCRSVIVIVVSGKASTTLFLISLQNTKIEWPVSIKMFTRLYP